MKISPVSRLIAVWLLLGHFRPAHADPHYDDLARTARGFLTEMVEADTSNPPGLEQRIVVIVARHLHDAGIPYQVSEFEPKRQSIVARLVAAKPTAKPLLLLAHIDVVGAANQPWTFPPHKVTEKDGYLYGRGVNDDLGMAAVNLTVFIALKQSGVALHRDVILALTGDEETGGKGTVDLIRNHFPWIDAGVAINEGGRPNLEKDGTVQMVTLQVAEKTYQDFEIVATGDTGHSSAPRPNNAIYRLADALGRLSRFPFPHRVLPITRAYLEARAPLEPPAVAAAMRALAAARGPLPEDAVRTMDADPYLAPLIRTTCVPTLLSGGTKANALPASARALVNCRILPDETAADVRARIQRAIDDPKITVNPVGATVRGGSSPVESPDVDAIRRVILATWPAVRIVPSMSSGATDSAYLRQAGIAAYGLNPLPCSDEDLSREHGIDERIPVSSVKTGIMFLHQLVMGLATGS